VNWDLIPTAAISTINLIPGSNPLFGLNTLGGALSIRTKSGAQYPGTAATLYGGSFGGAPSMYSTAARTASSIILRARAHFARTAGACSPLPTCASFFPSWAGRTERPTSISVSPTPSPISAATAPAAKHVRKRREAGLHAARRHAQPDDAALGQRTRWLSGDRLWSSTAYFRQSEKITSNGDVNEVSDPRNGVVSYDDGDPNASSVNRTRTNQRATDSRRSLRSTTKARPAGATC